MAYLVEIFLGLALGAHAKKLFNAAEPKRTAFILREEKDKDSDLG